MSSSGPRRSTAILILNVNLIAEECALQVGGRDLLTEDCSGSLLRNSFSTEIDDRPIRLKDDMRLSQRFATI
jgi:hypothetical protein